MHQIRGGEPGLIAPATLDGRLHLLWMSADGTDWALPDNVLPAGAGTAEWADVKSAVGDSGFVVAITTSFRSGPAQTSLIVGRLIED